MSEYRTKPLDQFSLKAELEAVCEALSTAGITQVSVSFGWDCNLDIEEMWKDQAVAVKDLFSFIASSEKTGIVVVGEGDIFIESPGFRFTLCHEGDAHVDGESFLTQQTTSRWKRLGYAPYEVQPCAITWRSASLSSDAAR